MVILLKGLALAKLEGFPEAVVLSNTSSSIFLEEKEKFKGQVKVQVLP